jgi:hypothetical protein
MAATSSEDVPALEIFEAEVDPEGILPAAERKRRAEHARKAHMQSLAFRAARAKQGLPPTIEDPATIERVAAILRVLDPQAVAAERDRLIAEGIHGE